MTAIEFVQIGKSICIFLIVFLLVFPIAMAFAKQILLQYFYIDLDLHWVPYCLWGAMGAFIVLLLLMDAETFFTKYSIQIIPK